MVRRSRTDPWRRARARTRWALACAVTLPLLSGVSWAQLGEATPEEAKIGRPSPFTAITSTTPPPDDPRDFAGMWRTPPMGRPAGGPGGGPPLGGGGPGGPGGGRPSSRYCVPGTMILASVEGGTEILQTPDELRIVTEEHHSNRRIYINQAHTVPALRSVNGDSVAHWDGSTLVIETNAFIGYGVSPTLVRTERLHKSEDRRTLIDEVSYADAAGRATPAAMTVRAIWAPGTQVLEYICEDGAANYMTETYK